MHAGQILGGEFADYASRAADSQRVVWNHLAFSNQCPGADQAVLPDDRTVQDHSLDADQAAFADRAAVQHGLVADRDVGCNGERTAGIGMQYAGILHIAAGADCDGFIVTAQRGARPDAYFTAQRDGSDDGRAFVDKGCRVNVGNTIAELVDRHKVVRVWSKRPVYVSPNFAAEWVVQTPNELGLKDLRCAALDALVLADPEAKCDAVVALVHATELDTHAQLQPTALIPGRPPRPRLVKPGHVSPRDARTVNGHAALLHAVAHIEFNAIGLALDAVWRFAGLPESYYRDWAHVAVEEAHHFRLLRTRLQALGFDYGDFDGHDGLWEMARKTADDPLARMALVPRTLEARGLDASPQVRAKLLRAGDVESAAVIDTILRDEIGHVAIGNRWYRWLCRARGLDSAQAFDDIALRYGAPRLRGPFNLEARRAAGFEPAEIEALVSKH